MWSGLIGRRWEQRAESFLRGKGLTTVSRNFSSRWGEIDLIMQDKESVVFVEVRYRKNRHFGGAAASINARKQQRLRRTASAYLQKFPALAEHPCRFDVLAIEGGEQQIRWIKNAF